MDPLNAANAFATMVGLLSNFKAEQSGTELTVFTRWLKEKHYEEAAAAIERNSILSRELAGILSTNHSDLVKRLSQLDGRIVQIASQFEGFGGLANALTPIGKLSEQAVCVLRQLVESGAEKFIEEEMFTGEPDQYLLVGGSYGKIEYADRHIIKDDLDALVSAGLLRLEFGNKGSKQFHVTRAAVEFLK